MDHYATNIRRYGAPNGLCSSITESKHIKAVKEPWRRSSRYEALGQMLLTNQRNDKLSALRVDFSRRGMLTGTCLSSAIDEMSKCCSLPLFHVSCNNVDAHNALQSDGGDGYDSDDDIFLDDAADVPQAASQDPGDDHDDGAVDGSPVSSYVDLAKKVGMYWCHSVSVSTSHVPV